MTLSQYSFDFHCWNLNYILGVGKFNLYLPWDRRPMLCRTTRSFFPIPHRSFFNMTENGWRTGPYGSLIVCTSGENISMEMHWQILQFLTSSEGSSYPSLCPSNVRTRIYLVTSCIVAEAWDTSGRSGRKTNMKAASSLFSSHGW